ncbi:MAG: SDR family oxidoreductase [Bacteroidetes bacterium]|nr:SDR family oxidoreductase [Bacteroidota bacterium]
MKFLVTGGAGFIGSNIAEELLKRGHSVRVLDNFSTGKKENLESFIDHIELINGDIRNNDAVIKAVKGVDVILHQAALPSVPRSIIDPITTNEVNVNGTLNILNAAKENGVKRVVFASSSSIYGDTPELPKHEGTTPNPMSPYAVSKLTGEKYCNVFSKIYGLETVALRYFNVFGPRQDPSSQYSAVIPKFIKAILNNEQPIIYGDGEQSRDFTYIENVVEANLLAATKEYEPGLAMNCATHSRITLNNLADEINKILGKNIKCKYAEPRAGDIKHSFANIELAKKTIRYTPLVPFEEGLKKTIEWYRKEL